MKYWVALFMSVFIIGGLILFLSSDHHKLDKAMTAKKWFNAGAAAGLTACQLTEDFNATSNYVEREFKQYWKEWECGR